MLKLTKTGIGLLTKQYRSVLRKCLIANLCILYPLTSDAQYATLYGDNTFTLPVGRIELLHDEDGGIIEVVNSEGKTSTHIGNRSDDDGYLSVFSHTGSVRVLLEGETEGGKLQLYSGSGVVTTKLTSSSFKLNNSSSATGIDFATNVTAGTTNASHLATTGAVNQLLNYYYTFRGDEISELIEFAKELRSNKKEMSSLDFMPIKSSSDLRINLIKAEDPLTFSAKTRDDSLDLMEVCHA